LLEVEIIYRSEENDSQSRKINIKIAITEICLPIDEMMFQER
jgi:hypothetical protein